MLFSGKTADLPIYELEVDSQLRVTDPFEFRGRHEADGGTEEDLLARTTKAYTRHHDARQTASVCCPLYPAI